MRVSRGRAALVSVIILGGVLAAGGSLAAATRFEAIGGVRLSVPAKSKKPLTKKQYIAQANALCSAAAVAFGPVAQQFQPQLQSNPNPSPQVIAAFVKAVASVVQHQIDKTRALIPPKRDRSKVQKFVRDNQDELNKLKANPSELAQQQSPFLTADSQARAYGLEGAAGSRPCTQGSGAGGQSGAVSTPQSS